MLDHFSWHQFLCAAIIFTLTWYLVFIPIIFRREISDFLTGKPKLPEKLKREWEEDFEDQPEDDRESLIGKQADIEGVSIVEMDAFGFVPDKGIGTDEQRPDPDQQKSYQQGLVPDILQEFNVVFQVMDGESGSRDDYFSLLKLAVSRYPEIKLQPNKKQLNDFIRENLPFETSNTELDEIWL